MQYCKDKALYKKNVFMRSTATCRPNIYDDSPNNNLFRKWFILINPIRFFFGSEGRVTLDRNPGPGYYTILLRLIQGDLLSACPHRLFYTLPDLSDGRAALSNTYPNAYVQHVPFYDGLLCDPAGTRSHDLLCERRTH